tara:strand:+ start:742 stop:1068 length:327 start_codon:yes stop_codon:yes gene_type:complete
MKLNVKKKDSILEVKIVLKQHDPSIKGEHHVPRVMINPAMVAEQLRKDGFSPGQLVNNNGKHAISNASWQDVFSLETVWEYTDESKKSSTETQKTQQKNQQNKSKKQK